jgi:hypothetical protein
MQDAADHAPIIRALLAAHIRRQKRLDLSPLLVAQPEQIASHHSPDSINRTRESKNHQPIRRSTDLLSFDPSY